jgi:alkanesulfonate monooxygenase SsuD/methylene tetrahydromethanopterin reductase-like flavin-dependent oxidoreductase (luciferase family)
MKFGFVLPGGPAGVQLEQAVLAEAAGWDGVFVWEGPYGVEPWSLLSAMAVRTRRVRLGTMLTPLPWRRPWKVASQAATLDELSRGRAILAVDQGEELDRAARAELLDDGIDLISALWAGETRFAGRRRSIDLRPVREVVLGVEPVQRPRIPIWVVGVWPRPRSMRRVVRCDGLIPMVKPRGGSIEETRPEHIPQMLAWLDAHGGRRPGFDVVVEGETPADREAAGELVRPWAEAGCTWWLDARWQTEPHGRVRIEEASERLRAGPPRLAPA